MRIFSALEFNAFLFSLVFGVILLSIYELIHKFPVEFSRAFSCPKKCDIFVPHYIHLDRSYRYIFAHSQFPQVSTFLSEEATSVTLSFSEFSLNV